MFAVVSTSPLARLFFFFFKMSSVSSNTKSYNQDDITLVGTAKARTPQDIALGGPDIAATHCRFLVDADGEVIIIATVAIDFSILAAWFTFFCV